MLRADRAVDPAIKEEREFKVEEAAAQEKELDLDIWGKSKGLDRPYPLICHLLDTAAMVAALWTSTSRRTSSASLLPA
jgi:hypothetical protein